MSDYDKLKELAEKATPWNPDDHDAASEEWRKNSDNNANFCRAAAPQVVLRMIDKIRMLEECVIQELTDARNKLSEENENLKKVLHAIELNTRNNAVIHLENAEHFALNGIIHCPQCQEVNKDSEKALSIFHGPSQTAQKMILNLNLRIATLEQALSFYTDYQNFGVTNWENDDTRDGPCWLVPSTTPDEILEIYGPNNTGEFGMKALEALETFNPFPIMQELKAGRNFHMWASSFIKSHSCDNSRPECENECSTLPKVHDALCNYEAALKKTGDL